MMAGKIHPLHKEIADKLEPIFSSNRLIRDEACGGKHRIPLFYDRKKSRATEYCNVDLVLLKENKIRVIIEIEESNVKPTQICGKFLTSALAKYYIHENKENKPVEMYDYVTFIQIVDASKLKKNSAKRKQWRALERSIQGILPLRNSKITHYILITEDELDGLSFLLKEIA
jgi:hypothetical protein